MKSILLKFADNVLSKNEMKALIGGNIYEGGSCGTCLVSGGGTTRYGCYKQQGGPTHGQCRCMTQGNKCS